MKEQCGWYNCTFSDLCFKIQYENTHRFKYSNTIFLYFESMVLARHPRTQKIFGVHVASSVFAKYLYVMHHLCANSVFLWKGYLFTCFLKQRSCTKKFLILRYRWFFILLSTMLFWHFCSKSTYKKTYT